jgi:FKBP-type peptidyl-prolyl cis-trans isomerase SlyD
MNKITTDAAVTLDYVMKTHLPDGHVTERPPETLEFIFGVERQAPSLERALDGGRPGDTIRVHIPPAEIYGERDPALVHEIPRKGLVKQRIQEGQYYRQMKKGCLVSFKILEVRPQTLLVDFNKPMAGIAVSMEAKIKAVRKATRDEIDNAVEAQLKRSIGCG